jgi:hypothetical protein
MKNGNGKGAKPKPEDRVQIWNTFFKLAWQETKLLCETTRGQKIRKQFNPVGGTLPPEEFHRLATLMLCALAIEARANHLTDELVEEHGLNPKIAEVVRTRLSTERKWFLLPELAGANPLNKAEYLHKAIHEICKHRNDLIHVNYAGLKKYLPSPTHTIKLFENFVAAMENMNVVLPRGIRKERKRVLRIGQFKCKPKKYPKEAKP